MKYRLSTRQLGVSRSRSMRAIVGASLALGTSAALFTPSAVVAAPIVSQGTGQLISTTLLGMTPPVTLNGANATNTGGPDVISDTPLDAAAVGDLLTVMAGPNNLFGPTGLIELGAVGQYARANADGSSVAFSGAVTSAPSLIGVNTVTAGPDVGAPTAGSTAQFRAGAPLDALAIAGSFGALAGSASQTTTGVQTGDYTLGDVEVVVDGTVVEVPVALIRVALGFAIAGISGVAMIPPANIPANPFPADDTVTLTSADLEAVVPGGDLENLPPNTVLSDYIPEAVTGKVNALIDAFDDTATNGLMGATLTSVNMILATMHMTVDPVLATLSTITEPALETALGALVQVTVNAQSTANGTFTETALRLALAAGLGPLAEVNLASAAVGPNGGPLPAATPAPNANAGGLAHTGSESLMLAGLAGAVLLVGSATMMTGRRRSRSASND